MLKGNLNTKLYCIFRELDGVQELLAYPNVLSQRVKVRCRPAFQAVNPLFANWECHRVNPNALLDELSIPSISI